MEGKTPILPGLDDMDIDSRRVLTRIDINVPVRDGTVSDPTRIERVAPTIRHILDRGGRPVLISHLGRPKGRVVDDMSLEVTVPTLAAAIGAPVTFVPGLPGKESVPAVKSAGVGEVLLLENPAFRAWRRGERSRLLPANSRCSGTYTATMPSPPLTEPMHRQQVLPVSCPHAPEI